MSRPSFDIFCKVIDNFGDIGVCWRLARQLANMPEPHRVRLWVDDLNAFRRIEPRLDPHARLNTLDGIEIIHWALPLPDLTPHSVVIEAFACDPPAEFIARMVKQGSLWINLEYLSAEPWVASCHALPSLQANGLRKIFFFPGFTTATGGLLREQNLLQQRDDWLANPAQRKALLHHIGLPPTHIDAVLNGAKQILLFAYPQAPAASLLQALNKQATPSVMLVPAGVCPTLPRGQHGQVYVHDMPFVSQTEFDHLLWSSDLNCVRGEDSLVRALWAGKPMLWHIYPQDDEAHMTKLQAWLDLAPFKPGIASLIQAWNEHDAPACDKLLEQAFAPFCWAQWQADISTWSQQLAQQPSLSDALVAFCQQASL